MPRLLAAALTASALVWLALLLLAPFVPRETPLVYQFASRVCHQRPERSFHLAGTQLPVCARCFGLYASGALAAAAAMLFARLRPDAPRHGHPSTAGLDGRMSRIVFAVAAAPTVVTVAAEWLGLAHPSNVARTIASLPLGAAAGWLFVRMLLLESRTRTRTARSEQRRASGAK